MPLDQAVTVPVGPAGAPVALPKGGSAFKSGGTCLARSTGAAVLYGVHLHPQNSVNSTRVRGSDILARNISEASFPGLANATEIDTATLDHTNVLETVVIRNGVPATRVGSDAAPGDGEFSVQDGAKAIGTITFVRDPVATNAVELDDTAGTGPIVFEYDGVNPQDPAVGVNRAASIANLVASINASALEILAINNLDGTITLVQEVVGAAGNVLIDLTTTAAPNHEMTAVGFAEGAAIGTMYLTASSVPDAGDIIEVYTALTPIALGTLTAGLTAEVEATDVVTTGVAVATFMG